MSQDVDYRRIDYPTGKPREEWGHHARRAYILERIEEAGHPDFISQTDLAREFDKSTSTIHRDFNRLREFVTNNIDERRLDHIGVTLYETAIKDEIAEENWGHADHLFQNWTRWLDKRGLADYLPDDDEDGEAEEVVGDITLEIAGVSHMDLPGDEEDEETEAPIEAAPEAPGGAEDET